MKKLILSIIMAVMLMASFAFAVDTCTVSYSEDIKSRVQIVTLLWIDDGGDGISCSLVNKSGFLMSIETFVGGTAPTNLYDIVLNNANGTADFLHGAGQNRSSSAHEVADVPSRQYVDGNLSLVISDASQNVSNATATARIVIWQEKP